MDSVKELLEGYEKADLVELGQDLGLTDLSLNEEELRKQVAKGLIQGDNLFFRFSIFDGLETELFQRAMEDPADCKEIDWESASLLCELHYATLGDGEFVIPTDVKEAFMGINDEDFAFYQGIASWIWKCLRFARDFYGYFTAEALLRIINQTDEVKLTKEELFSFFERFPKDVLWVSRTEDTFAATVLLANQAKLLSLMSEQRDKAYYVPTVEEVTEYYFYRCFRTKAFEDLLSYIVNETDYQTDLAYKQVVNLWQDLSRAEDDRSVLEELIADLELNKDSAKGLSSVFKAFALDVRRLGNRGHKTKEKISTMAFAKKVYPNDLCPCGSGRKYKQCCGKKG
ncbi:MAG: SEC-C domain-containing protein [Lachnospiraceae bacterium]|nr:SEC-C domain-containing protein [Lachnospiraceae bacterium]